MSREDVFEAIVHWKLLRDAGVKFTSRLLAQAALSGKIQNLGHQQGWIAAE